MPGNAPPSRSASPFLVGVLLGLLAALGYTAANIGLRFASHLDPFWVSTFKAWPTVLVTLPAASAWWWKMRGGTIDRAAVAWMSLAAVIAQLGGNVMFQYSLSVIGLAIAVPLNLGAMIISGAVLGRIMLNENVSLRSILAMVVLIVAIVILSAGTRRVTIAEDITSTEITLGVLGDILSGASYAFLGATIRMVLQRGLTVPVAMCISGVIGSWLLLIVTLSRIGTDGIAATDARGWWGMALAGVFNAAAFFALSNSLRRIPVVAVNLLNSTQAAMAGVAGWMIFQEPMTIELPIGVALTFIALFLMSISRPGRDTKVPTRTAESNEMVAVEPNAKQSD